MYSLEFLTSIFTAFDTSTQISNIQPLQAGHINDTFLIVTNSDVDYVLQKMNRYVFPDIPQLMRNKVAISLYLQDVEDETNIVFVPTKTGEFYHIDAKGQYWNMMHYISNTTTYIRAPHQKAAFEAGRVTGDFLVSTTDFDAAQLYEVLPGFHSLSLRLKQLEEAIQNATNDRLEIAKIAIEYIYNLHAEMAVIEQAIAKGKLPIRVTHNDTKISNILFSPTGEGVCLIDLDTVMPGVIHYDYGDALRTICSTVDEDEKDLSKVAFNKVFFQAYTRGFLGAINQIITTEEKNLLWASIPLMPFIIGIRFLTDFLVGDVYYKTHYPMHNWDRAQNQLTLVGKILEEKENIKQFIANCI